MQSMSISLMPSPSATGVSQQSLQHHLHQLAQNSAHTIQPHYSSSHNVGGAGPSQSSSLSAPPAFLLPQSKLQQMQPFSAASGISQSTSSFVGDHLSHFSFGSAGGMSLSSFAVPQQHPVGAVVGSNGPLVSGTTLASLITSAGSNSNNSSTQAAANHIQLFQGQSSSALPVSPLNYSPLEALKSSATLLTPTALTFGASTGTAAAQQQPSQQPFVRVQQQFLVHHPQHQQPQDEQPQINHHLTVPQQSLHPQLHHQQHAAMMMPSQPNQFISPGPHLGGSSSENLQHQIPPHQIVWDSAPTQFQQQQQQHHVLHYQTPS
ncbi:Hypothetical protein, putative [Bodo saltans]|uniref:Uncharacterized protein n=1 Tax=Bodo saltans TaxID=75058 RepID=A0A0S4J6D5_BODSA|nr:Hypothetical protein, putative [Bodo saltans]|eukprot:CUG69378.1 Hypothetical protein, putative [Bodo saltans]